MLTSSTGKNHRSGYIACLGSAALLFSSVTQALTTNTPSPSDDSYQSWVTIDATFFDHAEIQEPPGHPANRVHFVISGVEFRPNWHVRNRHKLDPGYEQRIRTSYASLLKQQLAAGFTRHGYEVVDEISDADISVDVSIIDLVINAPELLGITESYVREAGSATIELDFIDVKGERPFIRLSDSRQTRFHHHGMEWATRGRNHRDFGMLMQRWADQSANFLTAQTN